MSGHCGTAARAEYDGCRASGGSHADCLGQLDCNPGELWMGGMNSPLEDRVVPGSQGGGGRGSYVHGEDLRGGDGVPCPWRAGFARPGAYGPHDCDKDMSAGVGAAVSVSREFWQGVRERSLGRTTDHMRAFMDPQAVAGESTPLPAGGSAGAVTMSGDSMTSMSEENMAITVVMLLAIVLVALAFARRT